MTEDYLTYESKQTLADYIQFVYNMEPTIKLVIGTSNLDKVKKDERDDIDYTLKILKIKNIDNAIFLHTPFINSILFKFGVNLMVMNILDFNNYFLRKVMKIIIICQDNLSIFTFRLKNSFIFLHNTIIHVN